MIAHIPGHLCAADIAEYAHLALKDVYLMAHRYRWRKKQRKGHREVYYNFADVLDTLNARGA